MNRKTLLNRIVQDYPVELRIGNLSCVVVLCQFYSLILCSTPSCPYRLRFAILPSAYCYPANLSTNDILEGARENYFFDGAVA
jgi:hypothetical protein